MRLLKLLYKVEFYLDLALQHAVHPRQQATVTVISPTTSRDAPRLGPEELLVAGLKVEVCISVEDCSATLIGGLPTQKTMLVTESI